MQAITQTWISKFVDFAISVRQIKQENLLELCTSEHAENLYGTLKAEQEKLRAAARAGQKSYVEKEAVHQAIMKMTRYGIVTYGLQLCLVETSTLGSIFVFKLMIDYLEDQEAYDRTYAITLFCVFCALRIVTILSRSYYDHHVFVYFRFVWTKV